LAQKLTAAVFISWNFLRPSVRLGIMERCTALPESWPYPQILQILPLPARVPPKAPTSRLLANPPESAVPFVLDLDPAPCLVGITKPLG
jgi:hypothetical protein